MFETIKKRAAYGILIALLLSGCASSARSQFLTETPTFSATAIRPTSVPTLTSVPTPTGVTTPTGVRLPTRVVEPEPTSQPEITPQKQVSLLDEYLPGRVKVAETDHFIFYAKDGYFPVDQKWWLSEAETLYAYVSMRVDHAQVKKKIEMAFIQPETRACPIRGLASQADTSMILIYADQKSDHTYLLAVLAHELGHAIPSQGFANGLPKDLALTEGLATWAAGKYWDAWKNVATLDDLIREYISAGQYESISENYDLHGVYPWQSGSSAEKDCLARRDRVYSEWGDFTGYLIDTYGWDKAYRLFNGVPSRQEDGKTIEFPPDYEGIYGKSLNQLEYDWLITLKAEKLNF